MWHLTVAQLDMTLKFPLWEGNVSTCPLIPFQGLHASRLLKAWFTVSYCSFHPSSTPAKQTSKQKPHSSSQASTLYWYWLWWPADGDAAVGLWHCWWFSAGPWEWWPWTNRITSPTPRSLVFLYCGPFGFGKLVLEKTLESPLDSKEIKPVNSEGNQLWIFIGMSDAEAEAQVLWPPDVKSWLFGKDPDAGKDSGQEK